MFRRFAAGGFAVAIVSGSLAFFAGVAAHAAPPNPKCPNPAGKYPPGQCKFVTSTSSAVPGGTVSVAGTGFSKNCGVTIKLDTTAIGHTSTNGNGSFSGKVTIPTSATPGNHNLTANDDCSAFVLGEHFTVLPAAATTSNGSGLPHTGLVLWPMLGGGVALVAFGSGLIVAGRRRRASMTVAI